MIVADPTNPLTYMSRIYISPSDLFTSLEESCNMENRAVYDVVRTGVAHAPEISKLNCDGTLEAFSLSSPSLFYTYPERRRRYDSHRRRSASSRRSLLCREDSTIEAETTLNYK